MTGINLSGDRHLANLGRFSESTRDPKTELIGDRVDLAMLHRNPDLDILAMAIRTKTSCCRTKVGRWHEGKSVDSC